MLLDCGKSMFQQVSELSCSPTWLVQNQDALVVLEQAGAIFSLSPPSPQTKL
jgi:hypothetical protein